MKLTKNLSLALVLILVLAFALTGCQKKDSNGKIVPENAVAVVGDKVLDLETFNKAFAMVERSYNELYGDTIWTQEIQGQTVRDMIRERILDAMVVEELIIKNVESTGFKVSDEEIAESYKAFMETASANADLTAFYTANGIDEAYIKSQIVSKLMSEQFEALLYEEVKKDTATLEALYDTYPLQVDASHILVADEALAKVIKGKLDGGEDFAQLAKENSIDTGTAESGGALGLFARGTMVTEFENAAFAMKPGEISGIIKSKFGYHIIKVNAVQTLNILKANGASEEEIAIHKETLLSNVSQDAYIAKVEALRAEATIDTFPERIK
ncbi:MAG: peptidylprolyl isomerase [Erysipelotrichaceae bacterium]|nr:peptidylprolyl isomerase [Erysipelotrichaceae bacterium]